MLRVRFAEVSRSALQELGASFVANGFKNDWFSRASTQQFAAPDFDADRPGGLRSATSSTCSCSIRNMASARW